MVITHHPSSFSHIADAHRSYYKRKDSFLDLPLFPHFKPLELADKVIIERFVEKHPPYSDFNFVSLWNWNTDKNTKLSMLNDNLILQMHDYSSDNFIYSFFGSNYLTDTIEKLLKHAHVNKTFHLSLIPEANLNDGHVDEDKFHILEDRDQFDYIYDVKQMSTMEGSEYVKKRNKYKKFIKDNTFSLRTINLNEKKIQNDIVMLFAEWKAKKSADKDHESELIAIKNCFHLAHLNTLLVNGVYMNDKLTGFNISERLNKDYCMLHFQKTDLAHPGMSEYLLVSTAQQYHQQGSKFISRQQDLGIPGLRMTKEAWNPATFLKKYKIAFKSK